MMLNQKSIDTKTLAKPKSFVPIFLIENTWHLANLIIIFTAGAVLGLMLVNMSNINFNYIDEWKGVWGLL